MDVVSFSLDDFLTKSPKKEVDLLFIKISKFVRLYVKKIICGRITLQSKQ